MITEFKPVGASQVSNMQRRMLLDAAASESAPSQISNGVSDSFTASGSASVSLEDASELLGGKVIDLDKRYLSAPDHSFSFPRASALPDGSVFINNWSPEVVVMKDDRVSWTYNGGDFTYCHFRPSGYSNGICHLGISNRQSDDGRICAIKDGTVLWEYGTRGQVDSAPVAGPDGVIYAADDKGWLYAVKDNRLLWEFKANGAICNSPCPSADGTVYVSDKDGRLYSVKNGKEKWRCSFGSIDDTPVKLIPSVGPDGTLYAMSYWRKDLFGNVWRDNCRIIAIKEGRNMLGSLTARKMWEFRTDGLNTLSAYGGQDSVCMGSDGTIYAGNAGKVYAVKDGREKWSCSVNGSIEATPFLDREGNVWVGSTDGKIYKIKDGKKIRDCVVGTEVTSSPSIGPDGTLYAGSGERDVVVMDREDRRKESIIKSVKENKAEYKEHMQIEQTDDWLIIGGLKVPVKANYISAFAPSFSQAR